MLNDEGYWHLLEIELQATRQNSYWNLLWISSRKYELHMFRRLFESLEHGIKGMIGEHVHLVNHVDLVTCITWGVGCLL
jgi:hypothetical protein